MEGTRNLECARAHKLIECAFCRITWTQGFLERGASLGTLLGKFCIENSKNLLRKEMCSTSLVRSWIRCACVVWGTGIIGNGPARLVKFMTNFGSSWKRPSQTCFGIVRAKFNLCLFEFTYSSWLMTYAYTMRTYMKMITCGNLRFNTKWFWDYLCL